MSVNYEVQPQNYNGLEGELILAKVDDRVVGRTGYIPSNSGEYRFNGLNNARMKLVGSFWDIEVEESMRENGIGLGLLDKLFDQLIARSFDTLIIAQPDGQKKFYSKALGELIKSGKITLYGYDVSFKFGPVYVVRI